MEGTETASKGKRQIVSRGIPSKESFYLPPHYSPELRKFQDDNESALRNYWNLEELINFVFPKKYQPIYNEIAFRFMSELLLSHKMEGKEISVFIKENSFSKATFYNRVLPRLKRVGFIKVERETLVAEHSRQKHRPMVISLSKTFGNYLNKIGESWLAIIDDVRSREPKKKNAKKMESVGN